MPPFVTLASISAATPERQRLFDNLTLSLGAERVGLVDVTLDRAMGSLSGGEYTRISLAWLAEFDGALLVVSHDPAFLRAIGIGRELRIGQSLSRH